MTRARARGFYFSTDGFVQLRANDAGATEAAYEAASAAGGTPAPLSI